MSPAAHGTSVFKMTSLVVFLALGACASGAAQEKTEKFNAEAKPIAKPVVVAAGDCFENARANKALKENCKNDTTAFGLTRDGKRMTAAEIVRSTGKKVAIFQLAGFQCSSCEHEAKEFDKLILNSSVGKDISQVILFTDTQNDFQPSDFSDWIKYNAPRGVRAHDDRGVLWDTVKRGGNPGDTSEVRAPVFVVDANGNGAFLNVAGRVLDIFPAAERLVKQATTLSSQPSSR